MDGRKSKKNRSWAAASLRGSGRVLPEIKRPQLQPLAPERETIPGRVHSQYHRPGAERIKRTLDVIGACVGIVAGMPLFALIAVLIKLTSPGPVFFKQIRCGLWGKPFLMYKFRTMLADAESRKHELWHRNEMQAPAFKIADDPRITRVGKVLRKLSIDELPQLWNILKGEMSLVGPRPHLYAEVAHYQSWHRRRMDMKPGLTCLWQICGRNRIASFDEWIRMDLDYYDRWSLGLDIQILFRTVFRVLLGHGAM